MNSGVMLNAYPDSMGGTLDELVRGEKTAPAQAETVPPSPAPERRTARTPEGFTGRKIAGTILLCMAFLVLVLFTALGAFFGGLLFCLPFLLCGIVCFVFRENVGLWCSWALFFAVDVYFRYATGITWRLTRHTLIFESSWNYARLAIAWLELFLIVLMLTLTALRFRRKPWPLTRQNTGRLVAGWFGYVVLHFLLGRLSVAFDPRSWFANFLYICADWFRWPVLAALLVYTLRCVRSYRAERRHKNLS